MDYENSPVHPDDMFYNLSLVLKNKKGIPYLDKMILELQSVISRKLTKKQGNALRHIIINFISNDLNDLIISKNASDKGYNYTRYNKSNVGYTVFINTLKLLADSNLITYRYEASPGTIIPYCSVISATDKLKEVFERCRVKLHKFISDERELIQLVKKKKGSKNKAKVLCEYRDNQFSNRSRGFLKRYNKFLNKHLIQCSLPREELNEKESFRRCRFNKDHTLIRSFSAPEDYQPEQPHNLPKRGGRFYAGFWQSELISEDRRYITINRNKTVEIDYKAMGVNILYMLEIGKPCTFYPYDIEITLPNGIRKSIPKDLVKNFLMIGKNCKTWNTVNNALKRKVCDKQQIKQFFQGTGLTYPNIMEEMLARHSPIAKYYPSKCKNVEPIGLKVQFKDSEIMERLMKKCKNKNICMLPIHDSCIVEAQYKDVVKTMMVDTFLGYFKCTDTNIDSDLIVKVE